MASQDQHYPVNSYEELMGQQQDPEDHEAHSVPQASDHRDGEELPSDGRRVEPKEVEATRHGAEPEDRKELNQKAASDKHESKGPSTRTKGKEKK
jgi:hypothetical protein